MHVWFSLLIFLRRICLVWTNATRRSVLHISPSSIYPLVVLMEWLSTETIPWSMGSVYPEGLLNSFLFISAHLSKTDLLYIFKSINAAIVCWYWKKERTYFMNFFFCVIYFTYFLRIYLCVNIKIWKETNNNVFSFYRTSKRLLKTVLTNIGATERKA